ncbi:hypothetical protein EVAR_98051_1 [Eumeta japonica]|uniref:Uncharacterized protein n=1 Tax=Eumeta variegata TaxID=151549 RepID=A0A4C1WFF7_EUMVA|nr:hypothetical protein EVAR_98051_1 [Eumeta japonica]
MRSKTEIKLREHKFLRIQKFTDSSGDGVMLRRRSSDKSLRNAPGAVRAARTATAAAAKSGRRRHPRPLDQITASPPRDTRYEGGFTIIRLRAEISFVNVIGLFRQRKKLCDLDNFNTYDVLTRIRLEQKRPDRNTQNGAISATQSGKDPRGTAPRDAFWQRAGLRRVVCLQRPNNPRRFADERNTMNGSQLLNERTIGFPDSAGRAAVRRFG